MSGSVRKAAGEAWHLDKRVPIALIISLAVQTAGMVWWAASISSRVDEQSRRVGALEGSRDAAQALMAGLRSDTAVLRAESEAMRRQLDRIERMLDRRADAGDGLTTTR